MEEVMSAQRLYEAMREPCTLLEKHRTPDGEGGWLTTWEESVHFDAAFAFNSSMQAKVAEAQGVTSIWDIFTSKGITLEYHDVVRRDSDGMILRVTSRGGEVVAPSVSTLDIAKVSAERWELAT